MVAALLSRRCAAISSAGPRPSRSGERVSACGSAVIADDRTARRRAAND
jgi:hypothetical protein